MELWVLNLNFWVCYVYFIISLLSIFYCRRLVEWLWRKIRKFLLGQGLWILEDTVLCVGSLEISVELEVNKVWLVNFMSFFIRVLTCKLFSFVHVPMCKTPYKIARLFVFLKLVSVGWPVSWWWVLQQKNHMFDI